MNRRDFIKNMALVAGSISPLARIGAGLGMLSATSYASGLSGYKAIVIFEMDGGNDGMNMFPPTATEAYKNYFDIRTYLGSEEDGGVSLAVSLTDLFEDEHYQTDDVTKHFKGELGANQPYFVPLQEGSTNINTEYGKNEMYIKGSYHTKNLDEEKYGLGIHGLMPEMASLFANKKLSIVSNSGMLIEPTTKAQIENKTANLPDFLFSHGNQRELQGTLLGGLGGSKTGWAGRLADRWQIEDKVGLNISFGGSSKTFAGESTSPLTMSPNGATAFNTQNGINPIDELLSTLATNSANTNIFDRFTNRRNDTVANLSTRLKTSWENAPDFSTFGAKNSYGEILFTHYTGNSATRLNLGTRTHHGLDDKLLNQLRATAQMIKVSKDDLGLTRQIYSVRDPGYDFHSKQIDFHSKILRSTSLIISDFYKALEEMGLEKEVLLISSSEFGRTIKNNGDGTDHGWASNDFILCGDDDFNGGEVFGEVLTDLTLNGVNSYTSRARIIPTTSIEQMLAPALKWFGVDDATMAHVLPNLSNFRTDAEDPESAFLKGVFGETIPSEPIISPKKLKLTINATAPEEHYFESQNIYSSNMTYNGNIYVISFLNDDKELSAGRPCLNKINENNSSDITTEFLDKDTNDIYYKYDDPHHRFDLEIDKNGYIHVIGDMHHGSGQSGKGGSFRQDTANPIPDRFASEYGEQMYWISDNPEDISSFTFVGNDENRHFPANRTTYNYFITDNNGELYLTGRQSIRKDKKNLPGRLGLYLSKYDSTNKTWISLGGIDGNNYGFGDDGNEYFSSIFWEPHGYNRSEDEQWYQNYACKIKFDENNRMHITANVNADTIHDNSTHIIYAYSEDGGENFKRVDGTSISSLPMRITDTQSNRPDIVIAQTKDNPIFDSVTPGLFWDKDKSPAIAYNNISDSNNIRTSYRYYDKNSATWKDKDFSIKVELIRSDHFALNDGTMLVIGSRYQVHHINSFEDAGTIYELEKADKQRISYLMREVDKKLLTDRNILRGHSEMDGKSVIITLELP
jgi:uncharacterized protein (DUF1501 family)